MDTLTVFRIFAVTLLFLVNAVNAANTSAGNVPCDLLGKAIDEIRVAGGLTAYGSIPSTSEGDVDKAIGAQDKGKIVVDAGGSPMSVASWAEDGDDCTKAAVLFAEETIKLAKAQTTDYTASNAPIQISAGCLTKGTDAMKGAAYFKDKVASMVFEPSTNIVDLKCVNAARLKLASGSKLQASAVTVMAAGLAGVVMYLF